MYGPQRTSHLPPTRPAPCQPSPVQDIPIGVSHDKPAFYDLLRSYFLGVFGVGLLRPGEKGGGGGGGATETRWTRTRSDAKGGRGLRAHWGRREAHAKRICGKDYTAVVVEAFYRTVGACDRASVTTRDGGLPGRPSSNRVPYAIVGWVADRSAPTAGRRGETAPRGLHGSSKQASSNKRAIKGQWRQWVFAS